MTAQALLKKAAARLEEAGVPDAGWDAAALLEAAGGPDRTYYPLVKCDPLPEETVGRFEAMLSRRLSREPLQQIIGEAWFYGRLFRVSPAVLCPRSDTEILAETVLRCLADRKESLRLLDLCTGSGCLGITLAAELPAAQVWMTDLSGEALSLARENAAGNAVRNVCFRQGDLFGALSAQEKAAGFDGIICNPPYIPAEEIDALMPEVRDHEPRMALDGGPDGLAFYRRLAKEAPSYLRPGGLLALEIGCEQAEAVTKLLEDAGWQRIRVIRDLAGLDRAVTAERE